MEFYESMKTNRLVAIVRGIGAEDFLPAAQALYDGGVRLLEVTMNTDQAPVLIERAREHFGDKLLIGAGTVTDVAAAEQAAAAGAQFYITPNLDEQVIEYGMSRGIQVLPGVMTPTEIVRAAQAGAGMVKLFPVRALGASYVKELQGPLGHIPMVAVGGVDSGNAADFIRAGAVGVGAGGSLLDRGAIESGNFESLKANAAAFVNAVNAG